MISQFVYGQPVETCAVVTEVPVRDHVELLGSGEAYGQYVDDGYTKSCGLDRCVTRRRGEARRP